MKSKVLLTSVALVLCASGVFAGALAQDSETNRTVSVLSNPGAPPTVIVEDLSMPNRDVTSRAGKYGEDADIAVTGIVASRDDTSFILDRRDGQVRALIGDPGDDRVAIGETVTVYGRLKRVPLDIVQVETDVVKNASSGKTYLTMRGHERTAQMSSAGKTVKLNYHPL